MKIENLRLEKEVNRTRVSAQVKWEDCERPPQEIYFETAEEFSKDITCNPHAFLVACIMPAMRFGEERLWIDEEICPELRDGLVTAMTLICNWFDWYSLESSIVRIEAKQQKHIEPSSQTQGAGFLFSGGIDSLATLRANRLHYSPEHPGFIKDGLLIYGLEVRELNNFEQVLKSVSILARDSGVTLIPVYTNIKDLGPENSKVFWEDFWINEFMGATFSAVAHAFSRRLSSLSINSCHDIPNLIPYGSHPLLNPNFSSSDLKIRHEGIHLSRFGKTKLISDWDLALEHLRVCNRTEYYTDNTLNCGVCEKCVRTMLALVAADALKKTTAFPVRRVTQELVNEAVHLKENTFPLYGELLAPLAKVGRHDLVDSVERKIAEFCHDQKKEKWRKRTIQPIVEFDRTYLKGTLKKIKKFIKQPAKNNYYIAKAHYQYQLAKADNRFEKLPLLVYQMGKVGSLSVTETLRSSITDRNIYHFHILRPERVADYEKFRKRFFPDIKGGDLRYVWLCQYIHKRIKQNLKGKKWNIITLVRDPIARSMSDFFENSTVVRIGSSEQYRVSSDWYGFDITISKKNIRELFQIFIEKYNYDRDLKYFDLEFKGVLGIDVYDCDFPTSKGFKICKYKEADILIIKLEHLNDCVEEALKAFLNISNFDLSDRNVGGNKDYAEIYRVFKNNAYFSETFLNKIYSSKVVRHFYSGDEIEEFKRKWSNIS